MSGRRLLAAILLPALSGCAGIALRPAPPSGAAATTSEETVLVGPVTREEIEEAMPEWSFDLIEASPDPEASAGLASAPPGARVTVLFGTWCSDSRHELTRLWRALDFIGDQPSFALLYVGIDGEKAQPSEWVVDRDILFVPTLIVERDGREVGRIIEHSPNGVEVDLLALLEGEAEGWISARDDLPQAAAEAAKER